MRKVLEQCPGCGALLEITRLRCNQCDTTIEGHYQSCNFCRLTPEHIEFVMLFVRLRGNVKEMERELDIPYSAVRNRLNEVIQALGYEPAAELPAEETDLTARRREILNQLEQGEIDPEEAIQRLEQLSSMT